MRDFSKYPKNLSLLWSSWISSFLSGGSARTLTPGYWLSGLRPFDGPHYQVLKQSLRCAPLIIRRVFSYYADGPEPRPHKFQEKIPVLLGSLILAVLFYPACAKVGEPQPPVIYIPKPSVDLTCRQVADQMLLSVSLPSVNTNGTPVNNLKTVEVFRADVDLAQATTPLNEGDFLKGGTRILSVSETEISKYKYGNKLVFTDLLPLYENAGLYSQARIYSVRFLNRKGQTAGFGNQASLVPVPVPPPPMLLPAVVTQAAIQLKWLPPTENIDGSKPARILGYNIYRSVDSQNVPDRPLNPQPLQGSEFDDHEFEFDKTYAYAVSVVASEKQPFAESLPSKTLSVTPRDTFPPGAPQNLNAVAEDGGIVLLWTSPADSDVAGYRIYRSDTGSTTKTLLNADLIKTLSYRDATTQAERRYVYNVTAVDVHNNESAAATVAVDIQ
jgi:hypothetical protein